MKAIMNQIAEAVREAMGTECEVQSLEVMKNNGLMLPAVIIREPGQPVCPVIYIDQILKEIEAGEISRQDAAEIIVNLCKRDHAAERTSAIISSFDRQKILAMVTYQLINAEKNAQRLADLPHREFLDLAAIYIVVNEMASSYFSFTLNNAFCRAHSISEEELDVAARRNTEANGFCVQPIESILAEIARKPAENAGGASNMWVLSNRSMMNGAAVMLYNTCFDDLARRIGSDLYVLPSSIHEVIVIPAAVAPDDLRTMVGEINISEVPANYVLSENVYRYSRETSELTIA